jgi:hypothetical protein
MFFRKMVRPDRVEPPTFWFVGIQSGRILLIVMPMIASFEANTWRTTAAIDEKSMKGSSKMFFKDHLSKSLLLDSLPSRRVARGDEDLRGISVEEAGIEKTTEGEYFNLPDGPIELLDGFARPKRWILHQEGRRRLGFATLREEIGFSAGKTPGDVEEAYMRLREALRSQPIVPSQIPFPSGEPER